MLTVDGNYWIPRGKNPLFCDWGIKSVCSILGPVVRVGCRIWRSSDDLSLISLLRMIVQWKIKRWQLLIGKFQFSEHIVWIKNNFFCLYSYVRFQIIFRRILYKLVSQCLNNMRNLIAIDIAMRSNLVGDKY